MSDSLRRVSPLATQSDHDRFAVVDAALLTRKAEDAAVNARRREIHRFHAAADSLHRMVNALQPGTYVRPHRHLSPPQAEAFVLLAGSVGFVAFGEDGRFGPDDCVLLDRERGNLAVDVPAGTWHAVLALAPDSALFEAKPGPYIADKDFAPWAPVDGAPEAVAYLQAVEDRFRALTGLPPRSW
jgi:cupin fold WbuC family metalloprotein